MRREMFNSEMARLSVAFGRILEPKLLDTYWDRLKNHNDELFVRAVDRLIDEEEHFPNVARIHRAYYAERDLLHDAAAGGDLTEAQYREQGRANARRLARVGLMSDQWPTRRVVHPPGSKRYGELLHTYDRLVLSLTRTVDERGNELEGRPDDTDRGRRFALLVRTLGQMTAGRDHFAAHGFIPDDLLPTLSGASVSDDPTLPTATADTVSLCPICKATPNSPGGFVRVDVMPAMRHFGGMGAGSKHTPIPCPACNGDAYDRYVQQYGVPPGMPTWAENQRRELIR